MPIRKSPSSRPTKPGNSVTSAATVQLLTNSNPISDHTVSIEALFRGASHLDCMTAFARWSGYKLLAKILRSALDKGLSVRFVIGLDFYHTEPAVLSALFSLGEKYPHQFKLYISGRQRRYTFHPKAYVFRYDDGACKLVIGSANLTKGGLSLNHEFSIYSHLPDCILANQVAGEIEKLIRVQEIELATKKQIAVYAERHKVYAIHSKAARLRADETLQRLSSKGSDADAFIPTTLMAMLSLMKADSSAGGFKTQNENRARRHTNAQFYLDALRTQAVGTPTTFLANYEPLVSGLAWHSGGLERSKNKVARCGTKFQQGLRALHKKLRAKPDLGAEDAYVLLHRYLSRISGAGTNVLTETLHTFDPLRFAVMNQNSVNGMRLAGYCTFPEKPNKGSVDGAMYADFCDKAEVVRKALRLSNMTELDALFNYAYWK
jgi:HKD family nuclease